MTERDRQILQALIPALDDDLVEMSEEEVKRELEGAGVDLKRSTETFKAFVTKTRTGAEPMTHQTSHEGHPYVQITFTPAGSTRAKTYWAIKLGSNKYLRASSEGGPHEVETADVRRRELILAAGDVVEKPAGVSLHYGKMEVLDAG